MFSSNAFHPLELLEKLELFRSDVNLEKHTLCNNDINLVLSRFNTLNINDCTVSELNREILYPFKSLKVLRIVNSDVKNITLDVFEDLHSIETLFIKTSNIDPFDPTLILKMTNLKYLGLHDIYTKTKIDYSIFKNLPNLERICFDMLVYKDLDFDDFPKLKIVEFVPHGNTQEYKHYFKETPLVANEITKKIYALSEKGITVKMEIYEEKRHFSNKE